MGISIPFPTKLSILQPGKGNRRFGTQNKSRLKNVLVVEALGASLVRSMASAKWEADLISSNSISRGKCPNRRLLAYHL
jgi:hypothetical protein